MLQTGLECVQVGEADPVWWVEHQELSLQEGEDGGQKGKGEITKFGQIFILAEMDKHSFCFGESQLSGRHSYAQEEPQHGRR